MSRGGRSPVMADVAKRAGVAPITVSRVINDHPSVTPGTRARVQQAIDELGYRSNMAARLLAGGRSRVIGTIGAETSLYGPLYTLFGIEAAARASGLKVNFVTMREHTVDELQLCFEQLQDAHVDGAIVIAPMNTVLSSLAAIAPPVPLVVTSGAAGAAGMVTIDQARGARLATRHLLDGGHRTVHHVRGPEGWLDADARSTGWSDELGAQRRTCSKVLVGDWTARSGYAAGKVFAADPDVTAIFVANDQMALGVMLALHDAGRDIPGDVSVVGFDDTQESEYFHPPLTTVRQDLDEVGRASVGLLLELIEGAAAREVHIEPTLVVRASTRPLRG